MCKVSVIIPVYNAEEYLKQCLDSLSAQTLREFEVICVDDGSTDKSNDLLVEYQKKDSRFVAIHQDNFGAAVARNNGFAYAKGEYVVFLDSDDFFADDFLEKAWNAGVANQADVVLFNGRTFDTCTGKFGKEKAYLRKEYLPEKLFFNGDDIPTKVFVVTSPAPWLRMVRAEFIRQKKIEFQNLPNSNDYLFSQLAMAEASRICSVNEDLVFYRTNNARSLQGTRTKYNLCFAQAVETLYDELNKRGLYEKYRISFVHSALGCFNDKIRNTKSVGARNEIFEHMLSDDFQRMHLLGHDVSFYGGNWLFGLANDQYELLNWFARHTKQAEEKKIKTVVARKSKLRPLVSVVIPMYNVAPYLRECLDSICSQTLRNIEIICVDDGSPDESLEIAVSYAQKDSRMVVYSHQNSGLSATRNVGIKEAHGKYIYFIDGDDVLDCQALSELSSLMEKNNLDMAVFDATVLGDNQENNKKFSYERTKHYEGILSGPEMYAALKKTDEYYSCAVMYMTRADLLRKNGLTFRRAIVHEDQPFTFQLMMMAKRVSHIQKAFYKRRVHEDSIMTRRVSFGNVHGLFFGYLDMSAALLKNEKNLNAEQYLLFAEHMTGVLATMQKNYEALTQSQQYCRFTLGENEPVFRNLAVKSFDEKVKLQRKMAKRQAAEGNLKKQIQKLEEQNRQLSVSVKKQSTQVAAAQLTEETVCPVGAGLRHETLKEVIPENKNNVPKRVMLQPANTVGIKKVMKKILPVSYNRSAFEAQVLADQLTSQTQMILDCHSSIDVLAALQEKELVNLETRLESQVSEIRKGLAVYAQSAEVKQTYEKAIAIEQKIDNQERLFQQRKGQIEQLICQQGQSLQGNVEKFEQQMNLQDQVAQENWNELLQQVRKQGEQLQKQQVQLESILVQNAVFNAEKAAVERLVQQEFSQQREAFSCLHQEFVQANNTVLAAVTELRSVLTDISNKQADLDNLIGQKMAQQGESVPLLSKEIAQATGAVLPMLKEQKDLVAEVQKRVIDQDGAVALQKKQLMTIISELCAMKLGRLPSSNVNAFAGETMIFCGFSIDSSKISCIAKSSKRESADQLFFDLKPSINDIHHDAIACTLATLCGRSYVNVYLELTISDRTKTILEEFTGAKWHTLGSIPAADASTSEKIMLNFSGGFDSLAAKAILPEETDLIAVDFGGWFEREQVFFRQFSPHVVTTNFRQLKYDREHWTFMGTGALLFAKTVGAKYCVFGTILEANADQINENPRYAVVQETQPFSALGLKDMRVTNGLTEVATVMLVTYYYPEYVQASLKSLAAAGSEKLYRKQLLTNIICKRYRRSVEQVNLDVPDREKIAVPFGKNFAIDFLALYELKYAGLEAVSKTVTDIPQEVFELVERLSLRLYERLNTKFLHTIPESIRQHYLDQLYAAGIVEYDENDWNELREIRALLSKYHKGVLL